MIFKLFITFWYIWCTIGYACLVYHEERIYELIAEYDDNSKRFIEISEIIFTLILILCIAVDIWNRTRIQTIIAKFNEFDAEVRPSMLYKIYILFND